MKRLISRSVGAAVVLMVVLGACSQGDGTELPGPVPTQAPVTTAPATTNSIMFDEFDNEFDNELGVDNVGLRTVGVVGDSLSVAAERQIVESLSSEGYDVVAFDAVQGRRIAGGSTAVPSGVAAVESLLQRETPELWVIALGTNDVGGEETSTAVAEGVDQILELVADTPVVWVNTWVGPKPAQTEAGNRSLALVAVDVPTVTIADWFTVAQTEGLLVDDGVHLTETGEQAFADVITNAVNQFVETGLGAATTSP